MLLNMFLNIFLNMFLNMKINFIMWLADVKNDAGWGMSTTIGKLKKINAFD
jgi:hypothetical protein